MQLYFLWAHFSYSSLFTDVLIRASSTTSLIFWCLRHVCAIDFGCMHFFFLSHIFFVEQIQIIADGSDFFFHLDD